MLWRRNATTPIRRPLRRAVGRQPGRWCAISRRPIPRRWRAGRGRGWACVGRRCVCVGWQRGKAIQPPLILLTPARQVRLMLQTPAGGAGRAGEGGVCPQSLSNHAARIKTCAGGTPSLHAPPPSRCAHPAGALWEVAAATAASPSRGWTRVVAQPRATKRNSVFASLALTLAPRTRRPDSCRTHPTPRDPASRLVCVTSHRQSNCGVTGQNPVARGASHRPICLPPPLFGPSRTLAPRPLSPAPGWASTGIRAGGLLPGPRRGRAVGTRTHTHTHGRHARRRWRRRAPRPGPRAGAAGRTGVGGW